MINISSLNPLYVSGATINHLDCAIANKNGKLTKRVFYLTPHQYLRQFRLMRNFHPM